MGSTSPSELDDATIEALLRGDPPSAAQHIAPFVAGARAVGDGPPPRPSPALARLMAEGPEGAAVRGTATVPLTAARRRRPRRALAGRAAGVALAAKVGLGAVAAAAGVGGAASLHVLPGTPGSAVRDVISAVTPFELDREPPAAPGGPGESDGVSTTDAAPDGTGGDHGADVSSDATGADDDTPGVDGQSVADSAPGQERRPAGGDPPAAGDRPETDPPPSSGEVGTPPKVTTTTTEDGAPGPPDTPPSTTGTGDGGQGSGGSDDTPGATARP